MKTELLHSVGTKEISLDKADVVLECQPVGLIPCLA